MSTDASGPGFILDHQEAGLYVGFFVTSGTYAPLR
jgi:hypothetical protein